MSDEFQRAADPEKYPGPYDHLIQTEIANGLTDDEILDWIQTPTTLPLFAQRELRIRIQAFRQLAEAPALKLAPEDTPENVRAERARRIAAREPSGYKALAKHFASTETTIRRRLGKDKGWK